MRLVLADAVRLLLGGAAAGVALAVAAYQLLQSVLFGVGPFDGLALSAAPASRAARLMPTEALRSDG